MMMSHNPVFSRTLVIGALLFSGLAFAQTSESARVSALGRLEPEGGIIRIAAPSTPLSISGAVISELHVSEGDDVKAGDLLAVTDIKPLYEATLAKSKTELELTRRAAEAANSRADEACVRADVSAREAGRRTSLLERDLSSHEETEQAEGEAKAGKASCTAARANARVAESTISVAEAEVKLHEAELQRAFIRAPFDGRVLRIIAHEGEFVAGGVLEMCRVDRMYAIAEIYESDIRRVSVGQKATVTSDALAAPLSGKVEYIHNKVAKQDEMGTDPAARKDARIIEVEVLLDDPAAAAALTHLQVEVLIQD
jgi:HlyD family secretion protein